MQLRSGKEIAMAAPLAVVSVTQQLLPFSLGTSNKKNLFLSLCAELMIMILSQMPSANYLAIRQTCRDLRDFMMNKASSICNARITQFYNQLGTSVFANVHSATGWFIPSSNIFMKAEKVLQLRKLYGDSGISKSNLAPSLCDLLRNPHLWPYREHATLAFEIANDVSLGTNQLCIALRLTTSGGPQYLFFLERHEMALRAKWNWEQGHTPVNDAQTFESVALNYCIQLFLAEADNAPKLGHYWCGNGVRSLWKEKEMRWFYGIHK